MSEFTVPEINIVCIYYGKTLATTISHIIDGIVLIEDPDMMSLIENTLDKLLRISETEFSEQNFTSQFTE